jgi:hypothetical protein
VINDAMGPQHTALMRAEIDALAKSRALVSNCTHFVNTPVRDGEPPTTVRLDKSNIQELEMHMATESQRQSCPTLTALESDAGLRALLNVYIPGLTLTAQACKPQLNTGGGFPMHVDSDPTIDRRKVTAILYLNKDWCCERDGGALRIYPTPGNTVDIAPRDGRLVLMSSTETTHRVLPSLKRARYACTLWLSGTRKRARKDLELPVSTSDLALIFNSAKLRQYATRVALSDEWEQSLIESHGEKNAGIAVSLHRLEVERIRIALVRIVENSFPKVPQKYLRTVVHDPAALLAIMSGPARDCSNLKLNWLL